MTSVGLAVVGAGPQALTLLTYLAHHHPSLLADTVVFDPDDWLTRWHRQFDTYRIPMLRSGCVHHAHPDPYALIRFARERDREGEFTGDIGRPSTGLFADHCSHLITEHGFARVRQPERVCELRPLPGGGAEVITRRGSWMARRVVLASNPVRPITPASLSAARTTYRGAPGLLHSTQWRPGLADGDDAVVVGGGLTAAQIVTNHARAGGRVTWLTRAPLRTRELDVEAPWLGPRLRDFHAAPDAGARLSMARRARGGGSIPPEDHEALLPLMADGRVTHRQAPIDEVRWARDRWQVSYRHHGQTRTANAAHVVFATGSQTNARYEPLLRRCRTDQPTRKVKGFPLLASDLSWPGTSIHVMGPLAMIGVGPACRTIIGARIASERLVRAWGAPRPPEQYPSPHNHHPLTGF